jgi:hypothetical protein
MSELPEGETVRVKAGDRVRMAGVMRDDPCPMEIGATGTVREVFPKFYNMPAQIDVEWDNGRSLMLLEHDPFEVLPQ